MVKINRKILLMVAKQRLSKVKELKEEFEEDDEEERYSGFKIPASGTSISQMETDTLRTSYNEQKNEWNLQDSINNEHLGNSDLESSKSEQNLVDGKINEQENECKNQDQIGLSSEFEDPDLRRYRRFLSKINLKYLTQESSRNFELRSQLSQNNKVKEQSAERAEMRKSLNGEEALSVGLLNRQMKRCSIFQMAKKEIRTNENFVGIVSFGNMNNLQGLSGSISGSVILKKNEGLVFKYISYFALFVN